MVKFSQIILIASAFLMAAADLHSQSKTVAVTNPPAFRAGDYDRSINVTQNVSISMCVGRGSVKVNAWQRNEIRVNVSGGTNFGFRVMQKNPATEIAEWIMIVRAAGPGENSAAINECLSGGDIEIDAPAGANIRFKGDNAAFSVDGIRKVSLSNAGGDINIRNASDGVLANTFRGDIFIDTARGQISADSATGNVVIYETSPAEIGDTFRAKTTSGTISLEKILHRATEAHSITGSINFSGRLLSGANYYFTTETGALRLYLPEDTSTKFLATYSFGKFDCELPFKVQTENISSGSVKQIGGTINVGDATLRMTTTTGSIILRKK